ncbi:MAG: cytochrome c3 family protein, partial [Deltaproteobacteria bacterium]|nr:cytochrome c3 family protein [Deltaproteobacteria bacterium]
GLLGFALWSPPVVARFVADFYNPGPLTPPHAMWENQCNVCHQGDGKGGWVLSVSDTACLQCHDAGIHSVKQKEFIVTVGQPSTQPGARFHMKSAKCTECHAEHRGRAALGPEGDQNCKRCHEDLRQNVAANTPLVVKPDVVAFTPQSHPLFGRDYLVIAPKASSPAPEPQNGAGSSPAWKDPTDLKFNHEKHLSVLKTAGAEADCTLCHTTDDPDGRAKKLPDEAVMNRDKKNVPPWTTDKSRDDRWSRVMNPAYMQPVRYDRHCQGCHPLLLHDDKTLMPHEPMAIVRREINRIVPDKLAWLAPAAAAPVSRPLPGVKPVPQKPFNELIFNRFEPWIKKLDPTRKEKVTELLKKDGARLTDASARIAFYADYVAETSCYYCHSLSDTGAKSVSSGGDLPVRETAPTLIPSSPRRWYTHSVFDHGPHRNVHCTDCHNRALKSVDTSDLLVPNMTWPILSPDPGAASRTGSCTTCHHPPSGADRGAGATCQTCHVYHDRTKQGPPQNV